MGKWKKSWNRTFWMRNPTESQSRNVGGCRRELRGSSGTYFSAIPVALSARIGGQSANEGLGLGLFVWSYSGNFLDLAIQLGIGLLCKWDDWRDDGMIRMDGLILPGTDNFMYGPARSAGGRFFGAVFSFTTRRKTFRRRSAPARA